MKNRIPTLEEYSVNESENRQADIDGTRNAIVIYFDDRINRANTILLTQAVIKHNCLIEIMVDNRAVIISKNNNDADLVNLKKELGIK